MVPPLRRFRHGSLVESCGSSPPRQTDPQGWEAPPRAPSTYITQHIHRRSHITDHHSLLYSTCTRQVLVCPARPNARPAPWVGSRNEYDSRLPFRKAVYAAVWASLSAGICQAQHAHKKKATWLKGPGSHSAFGDAAFHPRRPAAHPTSARNQCSDGRGFHRMSDRRPRGVREGMACCVHQTVSGLSGS